MDSDNVTISITIMMASIRKRMLDKSIMLQYRNEDGHDKPEAMLSSIPWRLEICPAVDTAKKKDDGADTTKNEPSEEVDDHPPKTTRTTTRAFLNESFLDLRRHQNVTWADERLVEGIAHSKSPHQHHRAEASYQKGLEIVPDHTDLLTAYGAWLANQGRTAEALDKLERALRVDPHHGNAQKYRRAILEHLHRATPNPVEAPEGGAKPTKATAKQKPLAQLTDRDPAGGGAGVASDDDDDDDDSLARWVQASEEGTRGNSWRESTFEEKNPPAKEPRSPPPETKYPLLSSDHDDIDVGEQSSTSSDAEYDRKRKRKQKRRKRKRRRKKEKKTKKEHRNRDSDSDTSDGGGGSLGDTSIREETERGEEPTGPENQYPLLLGNDNGGVDGMATGKSSLLSDEESGRKRKRRKRKHSSRKKEKKAKKEKSVL